jgi:hypothetical protein
MNLVIQKDGIKRELAGEFGICTSRDDLKSLCDQLNAALQLWEANGFAYGWLEIRREMDIAANTKPIGWGDAA